jgi:DNA-binding NtrC family response regulator
MKPKTSRLNIAIVPLSDVPVEAVDAGEKYRVPTTLIVDDEPIIADTLSSILRLHGFAIATAYDGLSALEMARRICPSLLITDVAMPGLNGVELADAVKQMWPECSVLLFSAHSSLAEFVREQCELGPRFQFLQKPVHPEVMVTRVSDLLGIEASLTATLTHTFG